MDDKDEQPAVAVENLECRYGEKVILKDVSFTVRRQEIFFVVGPSGCGKTTLLRHLVGLAEAYRGRISYFGKSFTGASQDERREFSRSVGVLFQNNALWTDLSLGENVARPLALHAKLSRDIREEIVALKLAQVGLAGCQDRFPSELSGGMRKRAALARALALDPEFLFFDEPTSGLDPITARQIDHLIIQSRDTVGATIIVISHSLSTIFNVADRMILLDGTAHGIIAQGKPGELARTTDNSLVKDFLGKPPAGHTNSNHRKS